MFQPKAKKLATKTKSHIHEKKDALYFSREEQKKLVDFFIVLIRIDQHIKSKEKV
jgi:hypothetical protein